MPFIALKNSESVNSDVFFNRKAKSELRAFSRSISCFFIHVYIHTFVCEIRTWPVDYGLRMAPCTVVDNFFSEFIKTRASAAAASPPRPDRNWKRRIS